MPTIIVWGFIPPGNGSFLTKESTVEQSRTVKSGKGRPKLQVPRIARSVLPSHCNAADDLVFKAQTGHTGTQGTSNRRKCFSSCFPVIIFSTQICSGQPDPWHNLSPVLAGTLGPGQAKPWARWPDYVILNRVFHFLSSSLETTDPGTHVPRKLGKETANKEVLAHHGCLSSEPKAPSAPLCRSLPPSWLGLWLLLRLQRGSLSCGQWEDSPLRFHQSSFLSRVAEHKQLTEKPASTSLHSP